MDLKIAFSILRYLKDRLQEPGTVHRGVMAVGGIIGAFELNGPERWIATLIGVGNLLGILIPDAPAHSEPAGWNDADLPPIELQGRSHGTTTSTHNADRRPDDDYPHAPSGRVRVSPTDRSAGFNDQ